LGWIQDLYQTYEINQMEVGVIKDNSPVLLPIAHSTQNAQIEIFINACGEFCNAKIIPHKEAVTIIPVSEDSSTRSGTLPPPHPLADKLEYVAGDFKDFSSEDNSEKYETYVKQLEEWCESKYSVAAVQAVLSYVKKCHIVADLIGVNIFEIENNQLTKQKIEGTVQEDCFIRFSVWDINRIETRLFRDPEVFDSYIEYYLSRQSTKNLCYVTGRVIPCATKHPAKIRNTADRTRLISANDNAGFTYRGRLTSSTQVATVGYEVSQKAHNALRWLIGKQGTSIGEQVLVVWAFQEVEIESPLKSLSIDTEGNKPFTNDIYAKEVRRAVYGNYSKIKPQEYVMIMSVEAATTGRLSIPYYEKMESSRFIENVTHWYSSCFWMYNTNVNQILREGTPSVFQISKTAYGDKNKKLTKVTIERLVQSVINHKPIPLDIVKAAVANAVNPFKYDKAHQWEMAIFTACALIKKRYMDRNDERGSIMALDEAIRDRGYLFGRLLATAEKLERSVFAAQDMNRTTAAERYFQQFQKRPAQTWRIIVNCLDPYSKKLKATGKYYYPECINQICSKIDPKDFVSNEKLDDLFLLGYSCQMQAYQYKKKTQEQEEIV